MKSPLAPNTYARVKRTVPHMAGMRGKIIGIASLDPVLSRTTYIVDFGRVIPDISYPFTAVVLDESLLDIIGAQQT